MKLIETVRKYIFFIMFYCYRICYLMGLYVPVKKQSYIDIDNGYIGYLKEKFEKKLEDMNKNIDDIFYDKQEMNNYLKDSENELEKKWKSRIIIENTPRGNVIMYYDAYKMGFTYYCDKNVVSYDVLNAVAMKYTIVYRCRDFFMDESITGEPTKLMNIHFEKEYKKILSTSYVKTKPNPNKKGEKKEDKIRNKFIYAGKMNNYSILQRKPPQVKMNVNNTETYKGLTENANVQRNRISYKSFKSTLSSPSSI